MQSPLASACTAICESSGAATKPWSGYEAIRSGRLARDISFPDRNSFAVLSADAVDRLDDVGKRRLAEQLYNDVFWFDQAGCSSPRWLVWQAADDAATATARRSLARHLLEVIRSKRYHVETGMAIDKLTTVFGAAMSGSASHLEIWSNELTTVWVDHIDQLPRRYSGAGLLFECRIDNLTELASLVRRTDQTVGHFGFAEGELVELADRCNGRGVDRLVPIGEALAFSSTWDGLDLFEQMTRIVEIRASDTDGPDPREPPANGRGMSLSLNRRLTLIVQFVLDELVPPILRDSRALMYLPMRLVLGRHVSTYLDFKDRVFGYSGLRVR